LPQCLEPIFGSNVDGAALVSRYHSAHPSIAVGSPGPSSLPQPGDTVIWFDWQITAGWERIAMVVRYRVISSAVTC
jgi:hypothetical protein